MYFSTLRVLCPVSIILISFIAADSDFVERDPQKFGPMSVIFNQTELCKGPKKRNVANGTIYLEFNGENVIAHFNISFLENAIINEVKITIFTIKQGTKMLLYAYRVNKPCSHFIIGPSLKLFLHTTDDCMIHKGQYLFEFNYSDYAKRFYGSSFFYGEYSTKVVALAVKGNIMCYSGGFSFVKKI